MILDWELFYVTPVFNAMGLRLFYQWRTRGDISDPTTSIELVLDQGSSGLSVHLDWDFDVLPNAIDRATKGLGLFYQWRTRGDISDPTTITELLWDWDYFTQDYGEKNISVPTTIYPDKVLGCSTHGKQDNQECSRIEDSWLLLLLSLPTGAAYGFDSATFLTYWCCLRVRFCYFPYLLVLLTEVFLNWALRY